MNTTATRTAQQDSDLRAALARMLDRMDGKGEDAETAAEYIACDYENMTIATLVAYVRGG